MQEACVHHSAPMVWDEGVASPDRASPVDPPPSSCAIHAECGRGGAASALQPATRASSTGARSEMNRLAPMLDGAAHTAREAFVYP